MKIVKHMAETEAMETISKQREPRYKIVSHSTINGNGGTIINRSTNTLYALVNWCCNPTLHLRDVETPRNERPVESSDPYERSLIVVRSCLTLKDEYQKAQRQTL
ncbi:MAG TPA: hypothetical protein VJZ75_05865 [Candidatus Bathyarchaeia archaeon]|nr:hypothetical protein [Candidatus Bathyarchaeia archaeon]